MMSGYVLVDPGYVLALPLALARARHDGDGRLPFGPFLVAGALLAALAPVWS